MDYILKSDCSGSCKYGFLGFGYTEGDPAAKYYQTATLSDFDACPPNGFLVLQYEKKICPPHVATVISSTDDYIELYPIGSVWDGGTPVVEHYIGDNYGYIISVCPFEPGQEIILSCTLSDPI